MSKFAEKQRCPTDLDLNLIAGNTIFNVMPGGEITKIILKGLKSQGLEFSEGTQEERLKAYVQKLQIYVREHIRSCLECGEKLKGKMDVYQRELDKEIAGL